MAERSEAITMLELQRKGDILFNQGQYAESAESYFSALQIANRRRSDPGFDFHGFTAICNAGLSGSLGRLGKHRESLAAADEALGFLDRAGGMYPVEAGKWIMAVVNRGAARAMLDQPKEALDDLLRAKQMLREQGMSNDENSQSIAMVDQNIASVRSLLKDSNRKRWWRFWR